MAKDECTHYAFISDAILENLKICINKQLKKYLVIICILIFGYIQIGYYIHSFALRISAKQEFFDLLNTSVLNSTDNNFPLEKFYLSDIEKEMHWEEEGKEFWLKGQLYDVVSKTIVKGKTYLYCFNDIKEEDIVTNYINNIRKRSDSNHEEKELSSFFSLLFINGVVPAVYSLSFFKKVTFYSYSEAAIYQFKKIISPPPRN